MPAADTTSRAATVRERARQARQIADTAAGAPLLAQAAPHAALGAIVLAGVATHAATQATAADAEILAGTAATAIVVAVVASAVARRRLSDRKSRHRVTAFVTVAAGWLTTVTATGVGVNAVAVLVGLGVALSLHWWQERRIPNVQAEPVVVNVVPLVDEYAKLWKDNLGSQGGVLAGTRLEGREEIKAGTRYVLRLVPGKHTFTQVMGVLEQIRSGLKLKPEHDLIVEQHPVLDASCLQFTVVTRSPIKDAIDHPGPLAFNPGTGTVDLGPFVDGEGVAKWRAYTDSRLWGGFIGGGTGSGKSRLIEGVALSLAASTTHPTVIFYGDGQRGASSPLLMKHADHTAHDHEQIHGMAAGMVLVMLLRQDENTLEGLVGFAPTADRPGLLGIVDECQKPLSKLENPELWEHTQYLFATIAREGGKVGVAIILASQQTTLDAFGGAGSPNAEALRSNALAGNGICLRSKDPNAKEVFGIDINPKKFPKLPGYGWVVDPEPDSRSAPFRGYFVTDELREAWPEQIVWRSLDAGAANAYGTDYLRRRELAAEAQEAIRRRVEARRAGRPVPDEATRGQQIRVTVPNPNDGASLASWGILQIPAWDPQVFAPKLPKLHETHHAVLDAIKSGKNNPDEIAAAIGRERRQTYNLLDDLQEHGKIRRVARGVYDVADAA